MKARPDYQRRKIELERQRRAHRQMFGPDCQCFDCQPGPHIREGIERKLREQERRSGPPPF